MRTGTVSRPSVTFHLTCDHIIFSSVSVSVAEWPPFGNSCSLG